MLSMVDEGYITGDSPLFTAISMGVIVVFGIFHLAVIIWVCTEFICTEKWNDGQALRTAARHSSNNFDESDIWTTGTIWRLRLDKMGIDKYIDFGCEYSSTGIRWVVWLIVPGFLKIVEGFFLYCNSYEYCTFIDRRDVAIPPIACLQLGEVPNNKQPYRNLSKSLSSTINIRHRGISSPNNSHLILPYENLPLLVDDKHFELYQGYP